MASVLTCFMAACAAEPSPVEQCDDLVDVLCDRGVQCLGGSHRECVQAVQTELACGAAKAVSASYDRCVDQLQSNSCTALFPVNPQTGEPLLRLPADCMQVILMRVGATSSSVTPFAPVSLAVETFE
jgi:hypothetical protein